MRGASWRSSGIGFLGCQLAFYNFAQAEDILQRADFYTIIYSSIYRLPTLGIQHDSRRAR